MAEPRVPVIGVAGGIGAGKSQVAAALARAGCVVSDSDLDARAALADHSVAEALVQLLGSGIQSAEGVIDRGAVAHRLFTDAECRQAVEGIMHPWIEARRVERFERAMNAPGGPPPALVIDAPLLFEAGLDRICDAIIFVEAPASARLERVSSSRGWDEAELARRERAQWPLDRKRNFSTHIIQNDADPDQLECRTIEILQEILSGFRGSA